MQRGCRLSHWWVLGLLLALLIAGLAVSPTLGVRDPAGPAPADPPASSSPLQTGEAATLTTSVASSTPTVTLTPTPSATLGANFSPTPGPSRTPPATQPAVDVRLSLTVAPAEARPGDVLVYTLHLTNAGSAQVTSLTVRDTLPVGLVYVPGSAGSGQYDPASRRVTWPLAALDVGAETTLTFQARVMPAAPNPLLNSAEVFGPDLVGTLTATVSVHVLHAAEWLVLPDAAAHLAAPGGRVTLEVPAGSVAEPARFAYRSVAARPLPPGRTGASAPLSTGLVLQFELTARPVEAGAPITQFQRPLRLTIDLTDLLDVKASGPYKTWFVGYRDETIGQWVSLPVVDFQPGPVLTVQVDHFTLFGAGATGVEDWGWAPTFNDAQVALFGGAFTYNYPIQVPPGRAGLTPPLNLSYNSRRVDGVISWIQPDWAGLGWSIDSVEIVRQDVRRCKEPYGDAVCYTDEFVLVLNGTAYELKPGTGTAPFGRYHTAHESFLYIERRNDQPLNPGDVTTSEYWIVRTKDGTTYELGMTEESEQVLGPHAYDDNGDGTPGGTYPGDGSVPLMAYRWRVNQVTDAHDNRIIYRYDYDQQVGVEKETKANQCSDAALTQGQVCSGSLADTSQRAHYLHTIEYNHLDDGTPGVKIVFRLARRGSDVSDLTAPIAYGQTGLPLAVFWQRYYLQSLQVWVWDASIQAHGLLREYRLAYREQSPPCWDEVCSHQNNHTRLLDAITQYGRGGYQAGAGSALPATTFEYAILPNKGKNANTAAPEWEQEYFLYDRLAGVDNGYGGVITTTYQTPDGGHWQAWNYRVSQRWTQDRGTATRQVGYAYPERKADRCYDNEADGDVEVCDFFDDGDQWDVSGGRLVGYKVVTETLRAGTGNVVSVTEHNFWLKNKTSPTFALGREIETRYEDPTGTVLRTVQRTYTDDTAGRPAGVHFIRLDRVDRYAGDTSAPPTRTEYSYDAYGNVTRVIEHGNVDVAGDERTTHYRYYPRDDGALYVVDRVARTSVYAGVHPNDDHDPTTLQARTRYHYDLLDPNDPLSDPQAWTDSPTQGLLTQVDAWNGGLTGSDGDYDVTGYRYDPVYGNPIGVTDPLSRTTTTDYDTLFHTYPITQTDALGHATLTQYYGVDGAPATGAGAFFGQVEAVTDPNGATTTYTYDAFGRRTQVFRPDDTGANETPSVVYAYRDDLEPQTPFMRATWRKREAGAQPWSTGGTFERRFYDGLGRLIQVQTPDQDWAGGHAGEHDVVRFITYDPRGLRASESVAYPVDAYVPGTCNGRTCNPYQAPDLNKPQTTYEYDGLGRIEAETAPDGRRAEHRYGAADGLAYHDVLDPNRHRTQYRYDAYGRLARVYELAGDCGYWGYTCAAPYTTYWSVYATTTYAYDAQDNLTDAWDAANNHTQITYDPLGRKTWMRDPDMGEWSYAYDAAGNLTQQTDARGCITDFSYDGLNRLRGKTYSGPAVCSTPAVVYSYDAGAYGVGRRTGMSAGGVSTRWGYDARGRVVTESSTIGALGTYTTTDSYNSQDQVVATTYPDGEVVTTTYNAAGRPAALSSSLVAGDLGQMTYNAQGQPKLITYTTASLVTHFGYYGYNHYNLGDGDDAPDQSWAEGHVGKLWKLCTVPAGVACPQAGSPSSVLDLRYGYDGVDNILNLRDKTGGGDELQSFTYDALDRLTGVSGPYGQSYTYNAIGNLTYRSDVGAYSYGSGRPHAVTAAGSNSYGYDANGNMTGRAGDTLTYDAENRLRSVTTAGETITFVYDGDGRRVLRDTATDTIVYVGPHYELRFTKTNKPEDLDGDCAVSVVDIMRVAARWGGAGGPEDLDGSGTVDVGDIQRVAGHWRETCHVLAGTTKYYALGGRRVAMRKGPAGQAGTLYYLFSDHLGSTSVSYNTATGQSQTLRYYPWGSVRSGDVPTDRRFTGQRWDATIALYDYQARFYDPVLGRFTQPDPIVPAPGNPQSLNRYTYVLNNPLRYTDPTGHRECGAACPDDWINWQIQFGAAYPEQAGWQTGWTAQVDPVTQAVAQTTVAVLCEACDWGMTFCAWSQGDFSWWDMAGLLPLVPAAGVRHADDLLQLVTNPLPRSGRFARAVPERVARLIEAGYRDVTLGPPGDPDVFVTAAEDLARYRTQSSVERRLTLPPGRRAVVTFDYDFDAGPIASPVFREGPGFAGRGRTAGGAREWVIPNLPLDVQPTRNIRVRWLE